MSRLSFANMRIGQRLGLGFAILTGLMIALILLGILSMSRMNQRMHEIQQVSGARVWHANAIRSAAQSAERVALVMASPSSNAARSLEYVKLLTAWATLRHSLQELDLLENAPQGRNLLDRLRGAMDTAMAEGGRAVGDGRPPETGTSAAERLRPLHQSLQLLQNLCTELVEYEKESTEMAYGQSRSTYEFTRTTFLVLGGAAVLFATLMAIHQTRTITGPLRDGVAIAHRLADGDLSVDIQVGRKDETGDLLTALREMAERLRQTKSLEAQLLQAQKLETVGQLAGGVAHDFNNLLSVIIGHAQMGQSPGRDIPALQRHFTAIQQAGDRAAALTRQLLAFSRKQVMDVRVLDVSALVGNLKKMLTRLIGEDIELITTLADHPGRVRADPVQIEQIIMNLAVNARDAMPLGGKLTIITQPVELDAAYARQHLGVVSGPYVMLAVSDTGEGMTPEVRERIFEPFFTTKPEGKGTGLGLSTVYGIVKQSGGDIWVYSEPGRGSTFKVFLPRVEDPSTPTDAKNPLSEMPRGSETILLAEDEAPVRAVVRSVLVEQGYSVLEAANGHEALEICDRHAGPIHLLVTDMVMPGMTGLQLAGRLRSVRPDMPILFMSGYIEHDAFAEEFLKDRPTRLLQKPFQILELCRRVRQALDEVRAQVSVDAGR